MSEKMGFESNQRIVKVMGNIPTIAFGIQFKSKFEAQWAKYLEILKRQDEIHQWLYEPHTFYFPDQKKAPCQYTPDFRTVVNDGYTPPTHYWQELKGWLDSQVVSKFQKMRDYYPGEKFELVLMRIPKKGMAEKRYHKMQQRIENDPDYNITRIIDGSKILRQIKGIL